MKSNVVAGIIVFVILLVGGALFFLSSPDSSVSEQSTSQSSVNGQNQQSTAQDETQSNAVISAEEVSAHDSSSDCWTIIDGSVYDLTSYIPRHRGGSNILSACGVDATAFFNGEQAGQNGGVNSHSGNARNDLESLKIGSLE